MADSTNTGWEDAPSTGGGSIPDSKYAMNDAAIQADHPNWPSGGTKAQIMLESGGLPNRTSPTGAMGFAQVEPSTLANIEKSTGRKLDPNDPDDALTIHRYVISENLKHFGEDPQAAVAGYNGGWDPSKWNNPETTKYVNNWTQATSQAPQAATPATSDSGWEDAPKQPVKAADGWESAPSSGGIMGALKGAGETALNMATGFASMVPAGYVGATEALQGNPEAGNDVGKIENQLTYQPKTTEGQQYTQALGKTFDKYVSQPLHQGAQTALSAIPFIGEDLAKSEGGQKAADIAADIVQTFAPIDLPIRGALGAAGKLMGRGTDVSGGELGKINTLDNAPNTPAQEDPGTQMQIPGLNEADAANAAMGPSAPEAAPVELPVETSMRDNLRQGQLDFDNDLPSNDTQFSDAAGNSTNIHPDELAPFKDEMAQRVEDFNKQEPTQGDLFNDLDQRKYDQYGPEEAPRALNQDEFNQTLDNLGSQEGTQFEMPEDRDAAFQKYLDTVSDQQGGLFDRPTIAKNFVDNVKQDLRDQAVADHPIVKANQDKVAQLEAQLQTMDTGKSKTVIQKQLNDATTTLEKSKENIAKTLGTDTKAPWQKDGIVYMNSGIPIPGWVMNSIGKMLKGLHGIIFKALANRVKGPAHLNKFSDFMKQAVADKINKEASRKWETTPGENVTKKLQGVDGLRAAVKEFNPYEAQNLTDAQLKEMMQQAPDIGNTVGARIGQNAAQGGLMLTNMTKNPIVKYVSEVVNKASTATQQFVKNELTAPKTGLRSLMQAMTDKERTGISMMMQKYEGVKEFTDAELRAAGYSEAQRNFYAKNKELNDAALVKYNTARQQAGLPAVDRRIAHIASYFTGDFKRLITDKEGKVVAVLAHDTRFGVNGITKHFLDNHPDAANLTAGDVMYTKLKDSVGTADTRFQGYTEALNYLSKTNPDVARIMDTYKSYLSKDASTLLQMQDRAKFKSKEGVVGAEGRKPWQSAEDNAKMHFRTQLRYLESVERWSNMQSAVEKAKTFLADPEINKPNAKFRAQDYLNSVVGRNRGFIQQAINGMLNGVAETTGIGPSVWKGMNNVTKSLMLAKFVGIGKLSHSVVTLTQPMQAIPALNALLKTRGMEFNPLDTSVATFKALHSSMNFAKANYMGHALKDPFEIAADKYINANGVLDVNMSTHLGDVANNKLRAVQHASELNIRIPEAAARSYSFMMYSHLLDKMGMPKEEIFPTAHNLMRYAMVDYSPHERPLVFGKLGFLGDIASTLTRFKFNQISQHMVAAGEAETSIKPLMAVLATSIAVGGVRGIFAYEAANEAYKAITKGMAEMGWIDQPSSLDEIVMKSLHGMGKAGDMLNFGAYAGIGLNLTGSFTNADTIPTDPLGALVPYGDEISKMSDSVWHLAKYHNEDSVKQTVQAWLPNSMKGLGEQAMFTDKKGNYFNPTTGNLDARRSTSDQVLRDLSFRPIRESKNDLIAKISSDKMDMLGDVRTDVMKQAISAIRSNNNQVPADISKYVQRYIKLGGDPNEIIGGIQKYLGVDTHLDRVQRQQGIPTGSSLSTIYKYNETQEMK